VKDVDNSFEDNKEKGDKTTGSFFLMTQEKP